MSRITHTNNKPEFIRLIERYETITIEEIIASSDRIQQMAKESKSFATELSIQGWGFTVANKLTGYGAASTCSLCIVSCYNCHYAKSTTGFIGRCSTFGSYTSIGRAKNPEELLIAYRNRAKEMKDLL